MTAALVHLMQGDVKGLIEDAIELGFLTRDVDVDSLYPHLQRIYDRGIATETEKARYSVLINRFVG